MTVLNKNISTNKLPSGVYMQNPTKNGINQMRNPNPKSLKRVFICFFRIVLLGHNASVFEQFNLPVGVD